MQRAHREVLSGDTNGIEYLSSSLVCLISRQPSTNDIQKVVEGDAFIGHWDDPIKDKSLLQNFMAALSAYTKPASIIKTANSTDLPMDPNFNCTPEGHTRKIRHLVLNFKDSWFQKAITNSETSLKFSKGNAAHTDIFVDITDKVQNLLNSLVQHYKPFGLVFLICKTGTSNNLDGLLSWVAIKNGYTIIQLENEGKTKLSDVLKEKGDVALVEAFAHRIGKALRSNSEFVRKDDDKTKVLSPQTTYTFPASMPGRGRGRGRGGSRGQRGSGGRGGRGRGRAGYRGST